MKGQQIPLINGLSKSTNRYQLERPWYMVWNHILVSQSNFNKKNHLWTSPEFPVVVPVVDDGLFDATFYDEEEEEEDDDILDSNIYDEILDDSINEDSFFLKAKAQMRISDDDLSKLSRSLQSLSSAPERLGPSTYQLRSRPGLPDSENMSDLRQRISASSHSGISPVQYSPGPITSPSSPQGEAVESFQEAPNTTIDNSRTTSESRRSRIVDFAVNYLMVNDTSVASKFFHFEVHGFMPVKVPIVIEGKRAPERELSEASDKFRRQLKKLMSYAEGDFRAKKPYFFEAYSCESFIAIAFAGPFWSFAICRPGSSPITWSKAISVDSEAHTEILQNLFRAAEKDPNNPGDDKKIRRLAEEYQEGTTFGIVL